MTSPLNELVETRGGSATPRAEFKDCYPGLLYAHRLGRPLGDPVSGVISLEPSGGEKSKRRQLGIGDAVFCSVGVAPFWEPPIVLLFGPIEAAPKDRVTSPWDSGRVGRRHSFGGLKGAKLIERYSFSPTDEQRYLPLHLDHCFQSLDDFLAGAPPVQVDPALVFQRAVYGHGPTEPWVHAPEARFSNELRLGTGLLRAVLVDADGINGPDWEMTLLALRRAAEASNASFVPLMRQAGAVDYGAEASRFIESWLDKEGWRS